MIFDLNGTMLFDTPIQLRAWSDLAEETLGHGISREEFVRAVNGRTSRETVQYVWGGGMDEAQRRALIHRKRALYKRLCMRHPEVFHLADGVPEVLDFLQHSGVPFTIATSSDPSSVDFYFEHLDLGRWFDRARVVCSDGRFPGKPAPDIYRIAARCLDMPPEKCVVVEDAMAGVRAARGARIGAVVLIDPDGDSGIAVGNRPDQVDYKIRHHRELKRVLDAVADRPDQGGPG